MSAKIAPTVKPRMTAPARIGATTGSSYRAKAAAPAAPIVSGPVAKIIALRRWAATKVVGRAAEFDLVTLALAARVNVLLLGVPGTAKTMLVETLSSGFCPARDDFFDILMTKFTKPAEVFGPTDVVALRDESTLRTATGGFLPEARVGFLDEIFKASSAILNALLRLANERTFRNGSEWVTCPTRMLVGASNEMPEDPALLAAFYDRFPLKSIVNPLEDQPFADMIRLVSSGSSTGKSPVSLTEEDFAELDRVVSAVVVPPSIVDALTQLRGILRAKGIRPSDRRWAQAVKILKASAAIAGRNTVARADLQSIESVLWSAQEEIGSVKAEVANFLNPIDRVLRETIDRCFAARKEVLDAAGPSNDVSAAAMSATRALASIRQQQAMFETIEEKMAETQDDREKFALAKAAVDSLQEVVSSVCLGKANSLAELREAEAPAV